MLLNSFWNGSCSVAKNLSCRCNYLMKTFGFPVLILEETERKRPPVRVFFDDCEVSGGLALGDVVAQELDLALPAGSCIVVLGQDAGFGLAASITLVSELLHSAIVRAEVAQELSVFSWAMNSLSIAWRNELCVSSHDVDGLVLQSLMDILGVRGKYQKEELQRYMTLVEPKFEDRALDAGLFTALAEKKDIESWTHALLARYAVALPIKIAVSDKNSLKNR